MKPELRGKDAYKELYKKDEGEEGPDDAWRAEFFGAMSLEQIVELANAANYLDMPILIDACCEIIALHLRQATHDATITNSRFTSVSREEDANLVSNFSWAYNQSFKDLAKSAIKRLF